MDTVIDCVLNKNGEKVCNNSPVDVPVEEIIVHEGYQPTSLNEHNDLALLRLSQSVTYTDFIRPVCLPVDDSIRTLNLDGKAMIVSGFGKCIHEIWSSLQGVNLKHFHSPITGRTENTTSSSRKLKVEVNAKTNAECDAFYFTKAKRPILGSQVNTAQATNLERKLIRFLKDMCRRRKR